MKELIVFFLSGREYGVELGGMQGIERYCPMKKLPDAKGKMLGVVEIREEAIPVIDIRKCLIVPEVPVTDETRYVILRTSHGKLAFIVDGISDLFQIEDEEVKECPSLVQAKDTQYVQFIARNNGKLVLAINPEGLVGEGEWKEVQTMTKKILEDGEKDD